MAHRTLIAALCLTGCFSPSPQAGAPCSATGECPSGLRCSAITNTCEHAVAPDAPPNDGSALDAPPGSDATVDAPPGSQVVAHFLFDEDLTDSTGEHDGAAVGGVLAFPNGRMGDTDRAVAIPATLTSHVVVPDSPAFDLPKAQIEVWFRYDATASDGDLGIFSRDANGTTMNGHISLRLSHDRKIVLRIQKLSSPTIEAYRCTAAAVTQNDWHHVVITFGGSLSMQVDGATTTGAAWADAQGTSHECTPAWTTGIDGNDNPWVIGALSVTSVESTGMPVVAVAGGVQIDELLIRALP